MLTEFEKQILFKSFHTSYNTPNLLNPVQVGSSYLGMYNENSKGEFIVDKCIITDLDGTLTPPKNSFASNYIFYICPRLGISDSDGWEILKKLSSAAKTFDKTAGELALKKFHDAGLKRSLHLDACQYSFDVTPLVPGTTGFFYQLLKMGYFKLIESMSPFELVEKVGVERLENPEGFNRGTLLHFDESEIFTGRADFNFSPDKINHAGSLLEKYGYGPKTFKTIISDDKSDIKEFTGEIVNNLWLPAVWISEPTDPLDGLVFYYPEGRDNLLPLAGSYRRVELQIISKFLGKDQKLLNKLAREIKRMSKWIPDDSLFKNIYPDYKILVGKYFAYKDPLYSPQSRERVIKDVNILEITLDGRERKEIAERILGELKPNSFEFSLSEKDLEELS